MKVLFIHCAYQCKGGEDTVVEEEVKLLKQAGMDVKLLLFSNEGNSLLKLLQLPFNLSSYFKTKKAMNDFRPDAVHVHNLHFAASPSVVYAVKQCGVPLVMTLHNYRLLCPSGTLFYKGRAFLNSLQQTFPWTAVKKSVYKNSSLITFWMALSMQLHYWLKTWRLPDRFIVLSGHAKSIFLQSAKGFSEDRFVIKPNFCSVPDLPLPARNNAFLFVGRLTEEKGLRFLLKAFSTSPYTLLIAGDGPLKEEVISICKAHPNILYTGSLTKETLMPLMTQCSAMIFPSIWYEGMPLTIVEAFACGLPVIATRLGAMEYMVTPEHDGLLFEAGNEASLQQALERWQRLSPKEKEEYSANARDTYEKFYTPQKNAAQLLAIYQSLTETTQTASLAAVANS